MERVKKTASANLTRLKRFLGIFAHNARGVIGLGIIVIFAFVAIAAPLVTPYDPVNGYYVSGSYSAPLWLKSIPSALGGRPGAAENLVIKDNENFTNSLAGWNYTADPEVAVTHEPNVGVNENNTGSVKITFARNEVGTTYGNSSATLTQEFYFPFEDQPRKFTPHFSISVNGTTYEFNITVNVPFHDEYFVTFKANTSAWVSTRDILWKTPTNASDPAIGLPDELKKQVIDNAIINETARIGSLYQDIQYLITFENDTSKWVAVGDLAMTGYFSNEQIQTWNNDFKLKHNNTRRILPTTVLVSQRMLDVNMTVSVYIQRLADGKSYTLWPTGSWLKYYMQLNVLPGNRIARPGTVYNSTGAWIDSSIVPPDSDAIRFVGIQNVPAEVFPDLPEGILPGTYVLGLKVTFLDNLQASKPVETTVYVDDFYMTFEGTVWGIMGTNHYGIDLFSQLVYGSRISLYVGILSALLSVGIGLIVGLAAGYLGRYVDEGLMRFSDMLLVLPGLPLLIVLMAVLGTAIENLILLIGLLGWMGFARLVRSQVLSLKERPFVEAAKAVGAGKVHIISKHILPNVMSLVYVSLATAVPGAIVSEAALSFLGFYDPTRMSWGRMLFDVQANGAVQYWWWVIPPGLCIAALAVAFILLGFALDDVFNPKLRMRK